MAWYNTYRPRRFQDVIGQELIKEVLQKSIETGRVKHAYLFHGPRGIGKTTLARIFAHELNNVEHNPEAAFDIIEMDAASNTGIDDIRTVIESSKTAPLAGTYKIYIIDEVHMLSKHAMNALLKVLEEPPSYIIFLCATTNPEKLLPTIHSRVTQLPLSPHSHSDLVQNLSHIASQEHMSINDDALHLIAQRSEGSQRDAINLLETVASYALDTYSSDSVRKILGIAHTHFLQELLSSVHASEIPPHLLQSIESCGIDGTQLLNQLLSYLLEQSSKYHDLTFDYIIIPLAEIIQLQLPVSDALFAYALLQSKLRNLPPISAKQPSVKPSHTITQPSQPSPVKPKKTNNSPDSIQHDHIASQHNNHDATQKHPPEQTSFTVQSAQQAITNIAQDAKTPITIKLLTLDLKAEEIQDSSLIVSVSNGVYFGQLQSEKNISIIQKLLSEQLGTPVSIQPIQRSQKPPSPTAHEGSSQLPQEVAFVGKQSENPNNNTTSSSPASSHTHDTNTASSSPHTDTQPHNTTVEHATPSPASQDTEPAETPHESVPRKHLFYAIYREKPASMEDVDIRIITPPLPKPEDVSPSPTSQKLAPHDSTEWHAEVSDFEFE